MFSRKNNRIALYRYNSPLYSLYIRFLAYSETAQCATLDPKVKKKKRKETKESITPPQRIAEDTRERASLRGRFSYANASGPGRSLEKSPTKKKARQPTTKSTSSLNAKLARGACLPGIFVHSVEITLLDRAAEPLFTLQERIRQGQSI